MKKRHIGFLLMLLVGLGIAGYQLFQSKQVKPITAVGLIGGEKIGLVEDEEFKKIIKDKYNLTFDYKKAGSIDMVATQPDKKTDYLFPSSQVALDMFKKKGFKSTRDEIIFNTPIVIYSWKNVVKDLDKAGFTYEKNRTHFVKMDVLAKAMSEGKNWKDIGNTDLYGKILVDTTDPNKSNSGNMFLGLLANALNNNEVVTKDNVKSVEKDISKIYQTIGYMQPSSSDIFKQYLTQGMGAFPMVAGYENQILEFSKTDKNIYDKVKNDIVILYPEPTVWSSHVFISLNEKTNPIVDIFLDKEIQTLAWENHGFRTSNTSDIKTNVPGIAPNVTKVMQMPNSDTMLKLMELAR